MAKENKRDSFSKKKLEGVVTNTYLKKILKKIKKKVCEFWKEGIWELFTHREGASTPRAHHKEQHPLIECAIKITWFQNIYFLESSEFFYYLLFLFFFNRQGCCRCSYVSPGVMRTSNLRSSLSMNVCVLNWFYIFERFILIANKESLRR